MRRQVLIVSVEGHDAVLLTQPQAELLEAIVRCTGRHGFNPHGSDWPSLKRLKAKDLVERTGEISGGYRVTAFGRQVHDIERESRR